MIRAVATVARPDGTFDEVGMWNRTVIAATTVKIARRKALAWARQQRLRVEYHNDTLLRPAFRTEFW